MAQIQLESTAALTAPVRRMIETATEALQLQAGKPTPNTVVLDFKTMHLRDYSRERKGASPIIVHAPFAGWLEHPIDLPGRWCLQAVAKPFNDSRFCDGIFQGLGRNLAVADIHCPVFLLPGHDDDITPPVQVRNASERLGTPPDQVRSQTMHLRPNPPAVPSTRAT